MCLLKDNIMGKKEQYKEHIVSNCCLTVVVYTQTYVCDKITYI